MVVLPRPDSSLFRLVVRLSALALLIAGVTTVVLLAWRHPDDLPFAPVCPWYTATGLRCAGCGMTRALHLLLHGQLLEALLLNPLIVLVPPLGAGAAWFMGHGLLRGRFPVIPDWPRAVSWPVAGSIVLLYAYRTVADLLTRFAS